MWLTHSCPSIPHLSPAQQLPWFPTTATEHCKQPLLAQSITQGRHGLSLVSPSNEAFILGEIPAGWAEQTSFHLSPFFFNRSLARGKAAGFSPSPGTAAVISLIQLTQPALRCSNLRGFLTSSADTKISSHNTKGNKALTRNKWHQPPALFHSF